MWFLEESEFSKNKIATSISTQDGKIVIEMGEWKTPLAKLSNENWEKETTPSHWNNGIYVETSEPFPS